MKKSFKRRERILNCKFSEVQSFVKVVQNGSTTAMESAILRGGGVLNHSHIPLNNCQLKGQSRQLKNGEFWLQGRLKKSLKHSCIMNFILYQFYEFLRQERQWGIWKNQT